MVLPFVGTYISNLPRKFEKKVWDIRSIDRKMTSNSFSHVELDERAFAIFLLEGIQFYLDQDPSLRRGAIIDYCHRLWNRWNQMSEIEKAPFIARAEDELRRLRRYRRVDIYREVIREDTIEPDETRRRRRFPDMSN